MLESKEIQIFDRKTGTMIREKILGETAMRCCYGNPVGLCVTTRLLTNQAISVLYGRYNNSRLSRKKIAPFVNGFNINTAECEKPVAEYRTFNEFFARRLKPGARPVNQEADALVSPADGRLLLFPEIRNSTITQVKWAPIRLLDIFGNNRALAKRFEEGSCAIVRLCPTDYHRFHFPVSGVAHATTVVEGRLHSVHPYALENNIPVFCLNKRTICLVESAEFGDVALMEVGAMMVGSILQTYQPKSRVTRGDEKGYFEFGGSTCIMFFQKGRIEFDADLVEQSRNNIETLVRMGERIGVRGRT
jgi:phosphatidylserine decarboxylase